MGTINLGDLQRQWRTQNNKNMRRDLRRYLVERRGPSSAAFNMVARSLYVAGLVDNFGLADQWLAGASEKERAMLFSELATSLLK